MDRFALAAELIALLTAHNFTLTTAESCTGGLIAAAITDISGSSAVFHQGVITYANEAKTALLGVNPETLAAHGAVSAEVACEMAEGARIAAKADLAISATGIAGPTGGSAQKPVGLVFLGISTKEGTRAEKFLFEGSREEIRQQAVLAALKAALSTLRLSGDIQKQ